MSKKSKLEIEIPTLDDLFKPTSLELKDSEKVINIDIKDIYAFPDHPFKVIENEEMYKLAENINEFGVSTPIIVREKGKGKYEIISGHRRKFACEMVGRTHIPCIIRNLNDSDAVIQMVNSNVQREKILPSERAFAYKMKMEALKQQGKRRDLTSSQIASKLRGKETAQIIGEEFGDSKDTVYRYIRLTELIPELLQMVDEEKLGFTIAVELSYLTKEEQYILTDAIDCLESSPTLGQAQTFKKLSQAGELTNDSIEDILSEEKPNQLPKIKIEYSRIKNILPRNIVTPKEIEVYILECIQLRAEMEKSKQVQKKKDNMAR